MSRVPWGALPIGTVIPFFFESNDGTTGASEAMSGLAVTDIEVFKGVSMTQRSSDAGYVLLDTDGIDIDGIVGINGFSIDTGDNTDAGFFAAGSLYTVVVASVTIDAQTVNLVAGTFRLVAAENTAGTPVADTVRVSGTAQTARDIGASVLLSSGTGTGQVKLASGYVAPNWGDVGNPTTTVGLTNTTIGIVTLTSTLTTYTGNTVQTGDSFARIGVAGAGLTNIDLPNQTFDLVGNITGNLSGSVGSVTGAVGSVTGNVGGNVTGSVGSVVGAVGSVTGAVGSVTGAVGSVTGNVGGNVVGTVGSVAGAVGSVTGAVGSVTGSVGSVVGLTASNLDTTVSSRLATAGYTVPPTALQNATQLVTTSATTPVEVDLKKINGTTVNGDGGATPWGP